MSFILVYITAPTKKEAKKIARHLITKKLAACANIYSNVNSIYPWKGKISDETEFIVILKTDSKKYNKIAEEVKKIHSYSIPCIARLPVSFNREYSDWLNKCMN